MGCTNLLPLNKWLGSVGGKIVTRIGSLDSKARVEEIARMLGGLEITATTRMHARELLAS